MNKLLTATLITLLTATSSSHGFELWPELQFFDPTEQEEIENPNDFDAAYYSDIRTFSRRLENEVFWWSGNNVYMGSVGSLNAFRFQVEERLRLRHQVSEKTRAGVLYVHHHDFYYQAQNVMIEMTHQFAPKFQASIMGNFISVKQDLDAGVRLEYLWSPDNVTTFTYIIPQHSYNKRNTERGAFDVSPYTLFMSQFWKGSSSTNELFVRYEPRLNFRSRLDDQRYMFSKWVAGYRRLQQHDSGAKTTFLAEVDDKYERTALISDPNDNTFWRMQRIKLEGAHLPEADSKWIPNRFGMRTVNALWTTNGGSNVDQTTLLPFFEYRFKTGPARRADEWVFEYEMSAHWDNDPDKAEFQDASDQTLDNRLNIFYEFVWPQTRGRFSLMFTTDLDRFGTGETWNGGGGQAQFEF